MACSNPEGLAMFTNFLNLWILARVFQAGVATLLCVFGVVLGLRIVRQWRPGQSSERQLALERQAELVASVMQVTLILEVLGLGLSVFVTDHLVGGIRGAMCAFGVLASTPMGFHGLFVSVLTAMACGLWVVLHRFDLRIEAPVLTRRKFTWLIPVGVLALGDFALVLAFAWQLDFQVIASCCSVWVDAAVVNAHAAKLMLSPTGAGALGLAAALVAAATSAAAGRWPRRAVTLAACGASALASVAVLPAVLGVVAPHVLSTPTHFCPFCLFHVQGGGIGWPLFSAIFVGSVTGMGLGIVELNRASVGDVAPVREMQKSLGCWSAVSWLCALGCGVFPIARYWLQSGGASVFGRI
jgi:hypothetical protein